MQWGRSADLVPLQSIMGRTQPADSTTAVCACFGWNHSLQVDPEVDIDIIIHQTLKSSQQCVAAANSANRTLGMINRTLVNKHSNIMLRLYQSLVRPKLEYCIQAWRNILTHQKLLKFPGIPDRELRLPQFSGIPDREFLMALLSGE